MPFNSISYLILTFILEPLWLNIFPHSLPLKIKLRYPSDFPYKLDINGGNLLWPICRLLLVKSLTNKTLILFSKGLFSHKIKAVIMFLDFNQLHVI